MGAIAGIIVGGIVGAVLGGVSAAASGKSVAAGAISGGLSGAAIGAVAGSSLPFIAIAGLCGAIAGAGNILNQYANYKLEQNEQYSESGTKNTSTSSKPSYPTASVHTTTSDPKFDTNNTTSATFREYCDWGSVSQSALAGVVFGPLASGGSKLIDSAFVGVGISNQ